MQPAPSQAGAEALVLTPEDVNRLLTDSSSNTRLDMTHRIAGAYNNKLNGREMQVAEQIFRLLMRDTELRVRVSLAQYVKDSTVIPRDIVLSMSRDVEEVSLPVLESSQVLTDDDLINLVHSTEQVSHYLAISKRKTVSPELSDSLIARGNDKVAAALVNNAGAQITAHSFEKIVDAYRTNETLMQSISKRPGLPVSTVDKMITVVSASLADTLKKKYRLEPQQSQELTREIEKVRETETLNLLNASSSIPPSNTNVASNSNAPASKPVSAPPKKELATTQTDEEMDKLTVQMHSNGRLNPSILLGALCQGNFHFFEVGMARLAGIPISNARKLLSDRGDLGFRAIYNKSGLSDAMFPAVKLLLSVVRELAEQGQRPSTPDFANKIVERILQHSKDSKIENLSYIIALVRKGGQ